ncbi:MAG TPA: hypothetical protein ENI27_01415 [bacterium]|nr:hypothetical protein [bacterium]
MPKMRICPLCDETYEEYGPRHEVHEHPEPQSGPPRTAWLLSGMSYEDWKRKTPAGRSWEQKKATWPVWRNVTKG